MATPNLNVEFAAVKDEHGKFARLATLLGLADADHARGKCEHLWMACTVRGESKTGLPVWLVEQVLGERGPDALVEAELASWSRGRGDTKARRLRMAGAIKHCSWMANKTDKAANGGKSRASTASRAGGKFTSDDTSQNQPYPPHPHPPDPISEIPDPPPARAIPPVVVEPDAHLESQPKPSPLPPPTRLPVAWSGPPDHRAAESRRVIRAEVIAALDAARLRVATALGRPHRGPLAFPAGESDLMRRILDAKDLAAIRVELLHVVEMAALEAQHEKKSIQWLTGMIFDLPHDGKENKIYRRFTSCEADDFTRPASKRAGPKPTVNPGLAAQLEKIARLEAEEAAEREREETA